MTREQAEQLIQVLIDNLALNEQVSALSEELAITQEALDFVLMGGAE